MLTVTVANVDAGVTVRAIGEVDMHTAPVLAEALEAGCDAANRYHSLVVDLAGPPGARARSASATCCALRGCALM